MKRLLIKLKHYNILVIKILNVGARAVCHDFYRLVIK